MDQIKIGKFIASLRREKKLTQQELAQKLGVTDRAISKWENGRGMPDISLLKPLCDVLGITINELLSAEKLENEEKENKFDENILKTLKYSFNKIKNTKILYRSILTFIFLIVISLGVLFTIDIIRMRNNEPVFFSTWGFKYSPPLNLDNLNIEKSITEFLIKEAEKNKHYENEKSFATMNIYLITENKNKYYVYAWVLQEKYYEENGEIIKDSGSSIPYKFELVKVDDAFLVEKYTMPRDGSYYANDLKKIFPNSVLKDMEDIKFNNDILPKLEFEIKKEVDLYFNR